MSSCAEQFNDSPGVVVSRLTRYLTCVQTQRRRKEDWVSSQVIADALGITSATVRRDLAMLNVGGVTSRGYQADKLYRALVEHLGADRGWKALVVGAGNLGKALALHGNLSRLGFKICGIFDSDGRKIGKKVGKLDVKPMADLPRFVHEFDIDIGVIAVPAKSAQSVADLMVISGIKGIFNLSLLNVVAPERVKYVEARLVAGMLELSYAIKRSKEARRPEQ